MRSSCRGPRWLEKVTPEVLLPLLRERLSSYKIPRAIFAIDGHQVPFLTSQKPDRRSLADLAAEPRGRQERYVTNVVNHVGLCVTDPERSRAFYENVFGFTHRNDLRPDDAPTSRLLQVPPPVRLTAVYLELGAFVLELLHFDRDGNDPARTRSFTEPGLTHLSFGVDDVAAACERVRAHGGQVLDDTDLGGIAILARDPDGQLLELLPRR